MKKSLTAVLALEALAVLFPGSRIFAAAEPPSPIPVRGCVSAEPPVQPLIHLQTPRLLGRIGRLGREASAPGSGGASIVVPAPPLPFQPTCQADIGAAITGSVIDPTPLGISMNLLKDGFHLTSITLRSEADCDADGQATSIVPILESVWSTDATGQSVFLSQQPQAQGEGNLLDNSFASFWWEGFQYTIQIQFPVPIYGTGTGAAAGSGPDDSQQVLWKAIGELAPGLDLSCFSQRTTGTWSNLAALGIGDPRPAIPSGFSETSFELDYFTTAASQCAISASDSGVFLSVTFANTEGGTIRIGAWSLAGTAAYPGSLDDFSVQWSSDRYQFSVSGDENGAGLGQSVLAAIAQRLDPTFSQNCLLQPVTLTAADLGRLGFHVPQAPADYVSTSSFLSGDVVPSACARHFSFRGTYSLAWSFLNPEGLSISASTYRVVTDQPGPRTAPVVSDTCISWSDDIGTTYFVMGFSATGGAGPGKDPLIAVAKSMDPGLVI